MRSRLPSGFSLLELLLVMAVLGILGAIGGMSLLDASRQAQVRAAAAQLAADLQAARSSAQRDNQAVRVSFNSASQSYTVQAGATTRVKSLPTGTSFLINTPNAAAVTVQYSPPYGEMGGIGHAVIEVRSSLSSRVKPRYVKVMGVTGKVIQNDLR